MLWAVFQGFDSRISGGLIEIEIAGLEPRVCNSVDLEREMATLLQYACLERVSERGT